MNTAPKKIYPLATWALPSLYIGSSRIDGRGIFTSSSIKKGTIVIRWGGVVFTSDQIKSGLARAHTTVGIAEDLYLATPADQPLGIDDFMNHSCDPNIWMEDECTLSSRVDIAADEELTADYAVWLSDEQYAMKKLCNCSTAFCRGAITGRDWRMAALQKRYKDHFSPFINARISQFRT